MNHPLKNSFFPLLLLLTLSIFNLSCSHQPTYEAKQNLSKLSHSMYNLNKYNSKKYAPVETAKAFDHYTKGKSLFEQAYFEKANTEFIKGLRMAEEADFLTALHNNKRLNIPRKAEQRDAVERMLQQKKEFLDAKLKLDHKDPLKSSAGVAPKLKSKTKVPAPKDQKYSVFYMYSAGTLSESNAQTNISSSLAQDSPITLGLFANHRLNDQNRLGLSAYYSYMEAIKDNQNRELEVPPEYAINTEWSYTRPLWPVSPNVKLEYENLSTYNVEELNLGANLETREHGLLFLGAGLSTTFSWLKRNFLFKTSYAYTIYSRQSRPSLVKADKYTGDKIIFYLSADVKDWMKNLHINALYKIHRLEGANELEIRRYGLGFSVNI